MPGDNGFVYTYPAPSMRETTGSLGSVRHHPNKEMTKFAPAGMFDWATATDRARTENALMVDILEYLLIDYGQKHTNKQRQVSAALFLLSQYHQGASPITQACLENIFNILKSNDVGVERFVLLQSLAMTISKDERFIELVKIANPGRKRALSQTP